MTAAPTLPVSKFDSSAQKTVSTWYFFACPITFGFLSITISLGKGAADLKFSIGSIPSAGSMKLSRASYWANR